MKWDTTKKMQTEFILANKEVDNKKYYEMLECLPPVAMVQNAFLVGEPVKHDKNFIPYYDLYFTHNDKYFYGGITTENDFKTWLIPA
jgi:hypothetical protein